MCLSSVCGRHRIAWKRDGTRELRVLRQQTHVIFAVSRRSAANRRRGSSNLLHQVQGEQATLWACELDMPFSAQSKLAQRTPNLQATMHLRPTGDVRGKFCLN